MKLVFNSAKYSFFLLWLLSLPVLIETKYILTLWLKNVPDHTIAFTRIVLLTSLITAFRNPFFAAMHATGKIKLPNLICGSFLIATLPISYLFLKMGYKPEVVFIITLLINFSSMWIEWMLVKRIVYFSIRKAATKILIVSLAVVLLSIGLPAFAYYLLETGFIRFCLVSFFSFLSVIFVIYFIGIGNSERSLITNKIKIILRK
jgi:O-antigen/teichoic acid export membrane protein